MGCCRTKPLVVLLLGWFVMSLLGAAPSDLRNALGGPSDKIGGMQIHGHVDHSAKHGDGHGRERSILSTADLAAEVPARHHGGKEGAGARSTDAGVEDCGPEPCCPACSTIPMSTAGWIGAAKGKRDPGDVASVISFISPGLHRPPKRT